MARQVGDVLYYGTSGWANGYIGPDGRGVVRWKPPGMTKGELRNGESETRRIWTGRFGEAAGRVKAWWHWVPEGMRSLGDRYASQKMAGMLVPGRRHEGTGAGVLCGMPLNRDMVMGTGTWVDVLGEDRDFAGWSRRLPEGFAVRGMGSEVGCYPGIKREKLRARVHVHVGCLGEQVACGEDGALLPLVDWRHVTGWVELDEVEALCKVRLDWKGILRGRRVGDVVVLLGIEVGYVRGSRVVRLGCGSRLWVAWAGALELVPRRRVGRRVKRVRVGDRGAVRGVGMSVVVEVRGRDGPPSALQ